MATFPTLYAATRVFTPGDYPHTPYQTFSSRNRRVLHSNAITAAKLKLSFIHLSEADMLSVLDHYETQQGDFVPFAIPSSLLQGFTAADFIPTGYVWRYAEPPQVSDFCGPYHDVSVTLESVAAESTVALGFTQNIAVTFAAGAATASSTAPALSQTVTITFAPGAASSS